MKKKVISKDIILEKSLDFVIKYGIDNLNARNLAKEINCSTQPIYLSFDNMMDLKQQLLLHCRSFFETYINNMFNKNNSLFINYISSYIKFAYDYPKLYEFMFLKMENDDSIGTRNYNEAIIKKITEIGKYSYKVAQKFFLQSFIYAHGLATQIVTGYIKWDYEVINELLEDEFEALKLRYKGSE